MPGHRTLGRIQLGGIHHSKICEMNHCQQTLCDCRCHTRFAKLSENSVAGICSTEWKEYCREQCRGTQVRYQCTFACPFWFSEVFLKFLMFLSSLMLLKIHGSHSASRLPWVLQNVFCSDLGDGCCRSRRNTRELLFLKPWPKWRPAVREQGQDDQFSFKT